MPCPTERVGKCGEHLTASFLYSFGSDLVTMPHGSHADIVFEYKNILYKCQVKTVTKKRNIYLNITADIIGPVGVGILEGVAILKKEDMVQKVHTI